MTLIANAIHAHADYDSLMTDKAFAVVEAGEWDAQYRVGGDAEHGYYAQASLLGCGKTYATPEDAIRSLLIDNGYMAIRIEEPKPEPKPANEPLYLLQLPYLNEGEKPVVVRTTRRDAEMLREHGTHKIIGGNDDVFVVTPITPAKTGVTFQIGEAAY